jgi:hypothetical protein
MQQHQSAFLIMILCEKWVNLFLHDSFWHEAPEKQQNQNARYKGVVPQVRPTNVVCARKLPAELKEIALAKQMAVSRWACAKSK